MYAQFHNPWHYHFQHLVQDLMPVPSRSTHNPLALPSVAEHFDGIDLDELLNDFTGTVWAFICYIVMKVKSIQLYRLIKNLKFLFQSLALPAIEEALTQPTRIVFSNYLVHLFFFNFIKLILLLVHSPAFFLFIRLSILLKYQFTFGVPIAYFKQCCRIFKDKAISAME